MDTENTSDCLPGQFAFLITSPETSAMGPRRVRVSRACDRCKQRKVRCTGTRPCNICVTARAQCLYTTPYNRGRAPSRVSKNPFNLISQARIDTIDAVDSIDCWSPPSNTESSSSQRNPASPAPPVPPVLPVPHSNNSSRNGLSSAIAAVAETSGLVSSTASLSRASPEAPEEAATTDMQGHYVGPASGVSFLLRVQERLRRGDDGGGSGDQTSTSTTFTFGDTPLPDYDPVPSVMLSTEAASALVARFFDYTMPVDRFFHRPTIEAWLCEFCRTMGDMDKTDKTDKTEDDAPARRAVLWMIFAMAQEHMDQQSDAAGEDKSIRYFLAADYQVSKSRGDVTLSKLQVRLCQCYWLLGRSRVNHCWELFGSTARLALALGLHRRRSGRSRGSSGAVHVECSRKTFWSAYYLDTYLTMALGRPPIFHNEYIDQELPCGADDDELTAMDHTTPHNSRACSVALAPVSFYKLSRIQNKVLRDMYPIRPLSDTQQCAIAKKYAQALEEWRAQVPAFLCVDSKDDAVPLIPIFQRQRDTLNITYWHTIILTQRPFLLTNFSSIQKANRRSVNGAVEKPIENDVKRCLEAALHIVSLVEGRCRAGQMSRSFWGSFYFGFSAVVVLYVYTIQEASSPPDVYQRYLDAASRCHDQLTRVSGPGTIGARYCLVLEMLQFEAKRKLEGVPSPPLAFTERETGRENNDNMMPREGSPGHTFQAQDEYEHDYSADWTNWVEFEAMASTSLI